MKRISLRLTINTWEKLKKISQSRGITMNSLINTIAYDYIQELEKYNSKNKEV